MHLTKANLQKCTILFSIILLSACSGIATKPSVSEPVSYTHLRAPNLCNICTAWLVGLIADLASGGIFGQYALAYTVTAFFGVVYQRRLVLFNHTQQLLYVFILLLISQFTLLILKVFSGAEVWGWSYFLPSFTGILLWRLAVLFGLNTGGRARGT